uniref:Uncharacterized protein n=1 Tax=Rhizophora mucronata TaxID=61149 RepID=A0A2P2PCG3_RHIMU
MANLHHLLTNFGFMCNILPPKFMNSITCYMYHLQNIALQLANKRKEV